MSLELSDKRFSQTASQLTLAEYLTSKLMGSSLQVTQISKSEIRIDAADIVTINIRIAPRKKIEYTIFSKTADRPITIEEINGAELMDGRFEAEVENENKLSL